MLKFSRFAILSYFCKGWKMPTCGLLLFASMEYSVPIFSREISVPIFLYEIFCANISIRNIQCQYFYMKYSVPLFLNEIFCANIFIKFPQWKLLFDNETCERQIHCLRLSLPPRNFHQRAGRRKISEFIVEKAGTSQFSKRLLETQTLSSQCLHMESQEGGEDTK